MGVIPIIFVHTKEGRPVAFHIGRDRISATGHGPVVVEIRGDRIEVTETKAQIEGFIRDAQD